MSGVNEILIIAAIVAGIFFVPRMLPAKRQVQVSRKAINLSGKMRLAIAISIVYPLAAAAYYQPWKKDWVLFLYMGIGPVALYWLMRWVAAGLKDRRR
jgi:predicted Na+-dependent transporter